MRFISKLPHNVYNLLKCDWRSRKCSHASGRVILSATEFSPEGIHHNVNVMSALLHSQKSSQGKLWMSSFCALPFCTVWNIVLLSTSIKHLFPLLCVPLNVPTDLSVILVEQGTGRNKHGVVEWISACVFSFSVLFIVVCTIFVLCGFPLGFWALVWPRARSWRSAYISAYS